MNTLIQKILLVNDTTDDNNLGCKATTNALYELIEERLPNFEVMGAIKLFHTERPEIAPYIPTNPDELDMFCSNWLKDMQNGVISYEMDKLKRCDVVLVNGEGSIYKDVLKCRYQLFICYLAKKYLNKKVYIVNHTADISLIHDMAVRVYSLLDGIVAREPYSKAHLESFGIKNITLAPDAVFKYDIPNTEKLSGRLPVGFDINKKFMIIGGTSLNNPLYEQWFGKWSLEDFYKMILSIRDLTGIQVLLSDVGGDDFLRNLDKAQDIFYGKFSYTDYMILCTKALVHLSGRHHGSCLAAISGCPLLGLTANTHKMEGDFELLGWKFPVYNFYKIKGDLDNILENVTRVINKNYILREKIRQSALQIRQDVYKNVDILNL
jgi:hypothetical protein